MTWQERAEYALGEVEYALDNPGHLDAAYIRSYIRESAERIAFLEKVLEQAMGANFKIYSPFVHINRQGWDIIVFGGRIPEWTLGPAHRYPELAQYLRERADKETT